MDESTSINFLMFFFSFLGSLRLFVAHWIFLFMVLLTASVAKYERL